MKRILECRLSGFFLVALFSAGCSSSGNTGPGAEVTEEPGALGNPCKEDQSCNPGLSCTPSLRCQAELSTLPASIKQAVPPPDSFDVPSTSPILLFTTGSFPNVSFSVENYTASGMTDVTAQVTVSTLKTSKDKDVFVLSPKQPFAKRSSVVLRISGDITGSLAFNIGNTSPGSVDASLGFEPVVERADCGFGDVPGGWLGFGDAATIPETGSMKPSEGTRMLALSTGEVLCGAAIDGTTSLVVSGPLETGAVSTLSFDYDFQSSEFDDYCDSEYDDSFLAVLSGPNGASAKVVNSVNLVCAAGTQIDAEFPTQPDGGDAVYRSTGQQTGTLEGNVGSPATLTFVLTDVGDSILSTVVGVDKVRLGN